MSGDQETRLWVRFCRALLAASGGIAAVSVTDPPERVWGWVVLVVGIFVGALAAALLFDAPLQRLAHAVDRIFRKIKLRAVVLWVVPPGLVTILGWYFAGPLIATAEVGLFGCRHPVEVRVLTMPESLELYRQVAEEYEIDAARRNHGCRTAQLSVYAVPAEETHTGLVSGWVSNYLRDHGPRPDVWLPDSKLRVDNVRTAKQVLGHGPDISVVDSIAFSPIVLGVPAAMAGHGDLERQNMTWATLFRGTQASGLGVIRPDPVVSTVGDFATIALYTSEGGLKTRENLSRAREIEQWIGRSHDDGGYLPGDGATLLRRYHQLGTTSAAVITSEQALLQHNQAVRREELRPCVDELAPDECLLAYYPTDTHRLDFHFVRLQWSESPASQEQQEAASDFGDWLANTEGGKNALYAQGLRPTRPEVDGRAPTGEPMAEANGILFEAPLLHPQNEPSLTVRDDVRTARKDARRPGSVLMMVDTSGSMNTGTGVGTRFDAVKNAVHHSLELAGDRDEFGLSVFSGQGPPDRPLVPVASVNKLANRRAADVLDQIRPEGTTPLYQAIADGVNTVSRSGNNDRVAALVVLTDGKDSASRLMPAQLVERIRNKGVRVFVVAFGEANCSAQALTEALSVAGGSCQQVDVDDLSNGLARTMRQLWAGV